eukprot:1088417-Prymnesium_polylepis.2
MATAAACTPAFRLHLRPRFSPWPLEMAAPVTLPSAGARTEPSTRLALYCATNGMPAEPHLCLVHHAPQLQALVLVHVRIDGMVELLSNSSAAAWEQAHKIFFGQPPHQHGPADFDVVASAWQRDGRGVRAFEAVVAQRWREWEDGRTRAAQLRHEEERRKEEAKAELLGWLEELGLGECGALLIRESIDLDTLQYLCAAPASAPCGEGREGP